MLTEDYIMRLINQALAVFMAALGLKRAGKSKEALQTFDQSKEILLGLDANLVDQLDDSALLDRLTFYDKLDIDRLLLVADIYSEEGELYALLGQPENSQLAFQRSLRFYLESVLASEADMNLDIIQKVEQLRPMVSSKPTTETCLALLDYIDRLLDLNDDFLASAGISRSELRTTHASLSNHCDAN